MSKAKGTGKRYRQRAGQMFNFAPDSYLERTSRPVYAIFFLMPFIIFYEVGTILIKADVLRHYWQGRVTAFVLIQNFLEYLGFSSKFAWVVIPVAVVIILVAMQLASRKSWFFSVRDVWPMAAECILLSVPLIVLGLLMSSSAQGRRYGAQAGVNVEAMAGPLVSCYSTVDGRGGDAAPQQGGGDNESLLANIVTGIGAGIYEELVFRLVLICLLMLLFQDFLRLGAGKSITLSVVISAVLFSAHHHVDLLTGAVNQQDPFDMVKFSFRAIAGVYFAVVFAMRGFGVTAGTHAFYDIIATVIDSVVFGR